MSNNAFDITFFLWAVLALAGQVLGQNNDHLAPLSTDADWSIERISIKDGLSQRSVGALVSDQQGYLWIGTEDGLNRYDGYEFKTFKYISGDPKSISSSWINCILIDSLDNLWIGTNDGLNYFDKKTELFHRYYHTGTNTSSLSDNFITSLSLDRKGRLWVGTQNGLNCLSKDHSVYERTPYSASVSDKTIYGLLTDSRDRLWVGRNNLVSILDQDGILIKNIKSVNPPSDSKNALGNIRALYESANGQIWVGGINLHRFNEERHSLETVEIGPSETDVHFIYEDSSLDLWIGTTDLIHIDRTLGNWNIQRFSEDVQNENSVSLGSFVSSITEDINGHLWVGAWAGGLTKLINQPQKFTNLQYVLRNSDQVQLSTISGLLVDVNEDVWIGTWGSGLSIWNRNNQNSQSALPVLDYRSQIDPKVITGIFEDGTGIIWICTQTKGLYKADPRHKTVTNYKHDPNDSTSISANYLSYLYEDFRGQIWVSSKFNGLCRMDAETETFYTYKNDPNIPHSISSDQTRSIVEDRSAHQLWIGTATGGLNMYDHEKDEFTSFKNDKDQPHSLPSNLITELYVDRKDRLWVGTVSGLSQMSFEQPGHFYRYSIEDGLPNDVIYAIEEDEKGRLWISTNAGMTCFDPESKKFNNYNLDDGLLDEEYNGMVSCKNKRTGELFFGSIRSVTHFQPLDFSTDTSHAPLIITHSLVDTIPQKSKEKKLRISSSILMIKSPLPTRTKSSPSS